MTRQEALDWKQHPITQQVFALLQSRIRECEQVLGESAGINPLQDRFYAGVIAAHKDVVLLDFNFQEEISE